MLDGEDLPNMMILPSILLSVALLISLAKHPRRRKFRKYIRGVVDEQLGIGTLAARTLVLVPFDEAVNERTFVSSIIATWSLRNATPTTDVGPLLVGVAHSDYSAAEVEAYIEATGTWDEGDLVQQEVMKRKIRIVGTFFIPSGPNAQDTLNEGKKIRTKCGWISNQGQTLDVWAYNLGQAAFATTAPEVILNGHANLWPR